VGDLNGSLRDITNVVFVRTGTCAEPFSWCWSSILISSRILLCIFSKM
jgi:hypothetical protein